MIPKIQATNLFYYYADVEKAWAFYRDILGMETVADYGFAKILKLAASSYLTLVDAKSGMHAVDEPKSVTTAFVTNQVAEWYTYLKQAGVSIHKEFTVKEGSNHDGFVILDPEGYFLEFELFNPHQENKTLLPNLDQIEHTFTTHSHRPSTLGIQATVHWLYYNDLAPIQTFYESLFGVKLMVDQGWAKVYQIAGSGFLGLVDGQKGLHQISTDKCVTVSFFTNDVDSWFEKAKKKPDLKLRTPEVLTENGRVRLFVGYDPEGYFLEWDTFLPVESNKRLLKRLK